MIRKPLVIDNNFRKSILPIDDRLSSEIILDSWEGQLAQAKNLIKTQTEIIDQSTSEANTKLSFYDYQNNLVPINISTTNQNFGIFPFYNVASKLEYITISTSDGLFPFYNSSAIKDGILIYSIINFGFLASKIYNIPSGNISSTNIQDAINELDIDFQNLKTKVDRLSEIYFISVDNSFQSMVL